MLVERTFGGHVYANGLTNVSTFFLYDVFITPSRIIGGYATRGGVQLRRGQGLIARDFSVVIAGVFSASLGEAFNCVVGSYGGICGTYF